MLGCVFAILLVFSPVHWLLRDAGVLAGGTDVNNYKTPDHVYADTTPLHGFLNAIENGKANLETVYSNFQPFYTGVVNEMMIVENNLGDSLKRAVGQPQAAVVDLPPASTSDTYTDPASVDAAQYNFTSSLCPKDEGIHHYWAIEPFDFLDTSLIMGNAQLDARMQKQIALVNNLAKANTSVNFFVYIFARMQDFPYFTQVVKGQPTTAPLLQEFMSKLDTSVITYDYFKISTIEDRLKYVMKTDHHWTALGAYTGYCDIINMIAKKDPVIGPPLKLNGLTYFPGVESRGSAANIGGYTAFWAPFFTYNIDFPPHTSKGSIKPNNFADYMAGNFDHSLLADHYQEYFDQATEHHYYDNNTGHNLLIIGDSYTWASTELIAANFDNTYMYYPWDNKPMDYSAFIKQHDITDVLIMQFSDRLLFNIYNDDNLLLIKTNTGS